MCLHVCARVRSRLRTLVHVCGSARLHVHARVCLHVSAHRVAGPRAGAVLVPADQAQAEAQAEGEGVFVMYRGLAWGRRLTSKLRIHEEAGGLLESVASGKALR
jgi:hypothetical protein